MTGTQRHTHNSPGLQATAVPWPDIDYDPDRITLAPGDWQVRLIVPGFVADPEDPQALRMLLEYALATVDHAGQGPDALLDDDEA